MPKSKQRYHFSPRSVFFLLQFLFKHSDFSYLLNVSKIVNAQHTLCLLSVCKAAGAAVGMAGLIWEDGLMCWQHNVDTIRNWECFPA